MVLLRKRGKPPRLSQPPPTAAYDPNCRIEKKLAQFRRIRKYVRKSTNTLGAIVEDVHVMMGQKP